MARWIVFAAAALALGLSGEPVQARKCFTTNSEVLELQFESMTLDGQAVTDLRDWRSGQYTLRGLRPGLGGRAVILLVRTDAQGRPLGSELYRGVVP